MYTIFGLIILVYALISLPKYSLKIPKHYGSAIIVFFYLLMVLMFGLSYRNTGAFEVIEIIIITALIIYGTFKFLPIDIVNRNYYLSGFNISYLSISFVFFYYFVLYRKINLGISSIGSKSTVITLLLTAIALIVLVFCGIKTKYLIFKRNDLKIDTIISATVFTFLFTALVEEIIFRSLLFSYVQQMGLSYVGALILSSIVFGFFHLKSGYKMVFLAGIAGVFYGMVFALMGNIFCAAFIHTTVNIYRRCYLYGMK